MILKTENENNTHFKKIKKDIVPKRNTFTFMLKFFILKF